MANKTREALERRVQRAIWQESLLRWESAVVVGLTAVLTVLTGLDFIHILPGWAWLLGGLGAEAALVYSSISDPEFGRKVVADLLQRDFKPERLQDKRLQAQVNEALDYRSRIEEAIRQREDTLLKDELNQTASQIDEWLEHIYNLAARIDRYRMERDILERDRKRADSRIGQLQRQMAAESDPVVRQQIEVTLASIQRQIDTLQSLDSTIQRAELQLENTLTHLGTIYSQTMLVDVKDIDSGRARRLRGEISEEVNELNDILLAMDEVYTAESRLGG